MLEHERDEEDLEEEEEDEDFSEEIEGVGEGDVGEC